MIVHLLPGPAGSNPAAPGRNHPLPADDGEDIPVAVRRTYNLVLEGGAMSWQDRIVVDPNVLVGKPVIKGTRLAVEFIVGLLARGWTPQQVIEQYDHITLEDIQACLEYAHYVLESERVYPLPA
jgi:uncharacterized protein (DUF433 family)